MALANSDSCSVSHYNTISKRFGWQNEYKNSITRLLASYFGN
jgi:hypothetical protein